MADPTDIAARPLSPGFRQPRPALRYLAAALACTGAYFCVQLERVSYGGAEPPLLQMLCGGNETASDCRSVLMSSYGSVRVGGERSGLKLPVATIGSIYFVFVAIWCVFVGPVTQSRRYYHLLMLGVVALGMLMSLDYVRVMAVVLKQWCMGCLVVHGINAALFIVTIAAWPWGPSPVTTLPHPSGRLATATLAAGVLAATTQFAFALFFLSAGPAKRVADAYERVTNEPAYVLWNYGRQPRVEIQSDPHGPLLGGSHATHSVVVFTDFTCPRCRELHGVLERLALQHPDRVRIEYRHFPLDSACNPHPKWARGGHRGACRAGQAFEALRAAATPAMAAKFAAMLFERQSTLEVANFANWATEIGSATTIDVQDAAAASRVRDDVALGTSLGLNEVGTPVLYLDGRRFDGWKSETAWETLLGVPATTKPTGPAEP